MTEHLTRLQKELFSFAKAADKLNAELSALPLPEVATVDGLANFRTTAELQGYLSIIARKAEYVAAKLEVESGKAA